MQFSIGLFSSFPDPIREKVCFIDCDTCEVTHLYEVAALRSTTMATSGKKLKEKNARVKKFKLKTKKAFSKRFRIVR